MNPFKRPPSEKLKRDLQTKRDQMIQKAARLKKLSVENNTGWRELNEIIDEYIAYVRSRKGKIDLSAADEELILQLKKADHFVNALLWVKEIPGQYIDNLDAALKEQQAQEEKDKLEKELNPAHF